MDRIDILALSYIKGIGSQSIRCVAERIQTGGNVEKLEDLDHGILIKLLKGPGKVHALKQIQTSLSCLRSAAENNIRKMHSQGIEVITYIDPAYPPQLKSISDPPMVLYIKGDPDILKEKSHAAVVGTRHPSPWGRMAAYKTASVLVSKGYHVVSGLAKGIDTAAHRGVLNNGGKTIAVLVDVDQVYPFENKGLACEIVNMGGALIAENPPGIPIHKGLFVRRDRLQSALSTAVFVIETDMNGGAMHTARYAQKQNRLIFCPNPEYMPKQNRSHSEGVKYLISQGTAIPYSLMNMQPVLEMVQKRFYKLMERPEGTQCNFLHLMEYQQEAYRQP